MKKIVGFVDLENVDRTANWLLSRRKLDRSGEFDLNPRSLDTFGRANQDITDAYIVWVLSSQDAFDYDNLKEEFDHLEKQSQTTDDPYFLGLYSGSLFNVGKKSEALAISKRVAKKQNKETGAVEGAESSITSSNGKNLLVETTSIAMINWLNQDINQFSE